MDIEPVDCRICFPRTVPDGSDNWRIGQKRSRYNAEGLTNPEVDVEMTTLSNLVGDSHL